MVRLVKGGWPRQVSKNAVRAQHVLDRARSIVSRWQSIEHVSYCSAGAFGFLDPQITVRGGAAAI